MSLAAILAAAPSLAAGAGTSASNTPLDWNVSLRGQYTVDGSGGEYRTIIAPEVTLSLPGSTGSSDFAAGGEISIDSTGTTRIDELHANAQSTTAFDEYTTLSQSLDLSVVQVPADAATLPPNTATGPLEFTGRAELGGRRELEPFYVSGRVGVTRFIEGPTTLDDASTIDNSSSSYWLGDASLRLGFEVTPVLSVFVEGAQNYQKYDAENSTALAYLDGATTTLRAGVAAADENFFSAEISAGEAWHNYMDGALTDRSAWIYDASASFTPDDRLKLGANVTTAIGPSSLIAGDTDVGTTVSADAAVKVGQGVTLRGSADWNQTTTLGTGDISSGYTVDTGIDFSSSPQAVWSADYGLAHSFTPPGPATDSQTVTLGLKIVN